MERESPPPIRKLIERVRQDFSEASEILLSFPDKWEHIGTLKGGEFPLYIAGFPIERAFHGREHFEGLPPEINVNLVFYRLYKLFQPWRMPTVFVNWDSEAGRGRVVGRGELKVQLDPVGQAQVWFGVSDALIWECYFDESRRRGNWQEQLAEVWNVVEKDVGVAKLWTPAHEPTIPEGYPDFLKSLGYAPAAEHPLWWSKERKEAESI